MIIELHWIECSAIPLFCTAAVVSRCGERTQLPDRIQILISSSRAFETYLLNINCNSRLLSIPRHTNATSLKIG